MVRSNKHFLNRRPPGRAPKIENYADNEKIADLPRKLTEQGSGPFGDEAPSVLLRALG